MLQKNLILDVGITNATKEEVLEYIIKGLGKNAKKYFIVTPNPEILVFANKAKEYKNILNNAEIALPDGVGVITAGMILGIRFKERITGVELLESLCKEVAKKPITVGFLGGGEGIAERTAECLALKYLGLKVAFAGSEWPVARGPVAPSSHPMSSVASSLRALDGTPSSRATPRFSIVLDGAHNPTKMKAFLTTLKKLFPKQNKIFIVGFKFDKDIQRMLMQITKVADKIIITEFERVTDMNINASAEALNIKNQISSVRQGFGRQAKIKYDGEVVVEKDSKKALDKALAIEQFNHVKRGWGNSTIIVVTGSLYLVGEIRGYITKKLVIRN
jgi:hypothetical protein